MRANEFILENASVGGTSSGSVATVSQPLGGTNTRNGGSFFSGNVSADPFPNTPYKKKKKKKQSFQNSI